MRPLAPSDAAAVCTLAATLAVARSPASAVSKGAAVACWDLPLCWPPRSFAAAAAVASSPILVLQLLINDLTLLPGHPCRQTDSGAEGDRGQRTLLQPGDGGGGGEGCAAVCRLCGQRRAVQSGELGCTTVWRWVGPYRCMGAHVGGQVCWFWFHAEATFAYTRPLHLQVGKSADTGMPLWLLVGPIVSILLSGGLCCWEAVAAS